MSIYIVCKSYRKLQVLNCHESRIAHSLTAPLGAVHFVPPKFIIRAVENNYDKLERVSPLVECKSL